jgi:hypothetical protein
LPLNPTITRHIEGGRAEERPAGDDEIAGFWSKAVVAYGDARLASASLDARLVRAYDAGPIAATAIVRAGGYVRAVARDTASSRSTWRERW